MPEFNPGLQKVENKVVNQRVEVERRDGGERRKVGRSEGQSKRGLVLNV